MCKKKGVKLKLKGKIKHFQYQGVLYGRHITHNITIDFSQALQILTLWKNNLITELTELPQHATRHLAHEENDFHGNLPEKLPAFVAEIKTSVRVK